MRVLHIDTGTDFRGGQWQLLALARGLRERGCIQAIACPRGSELANRARAENFALIEFAPRSRLGAALHLRSAARRERFEVIHAHDGRAQTLAWLASAGLPVCRIASRRVSFPPRHRLTHRLKYTLTCDAVIAVSRHVRGLLLDCGVQGSRIEVIYDGVEIPPVLPDLRERAQLRDNWRLGDDDFVVGCAGAFTWEKGQMIALEAFRLLERDLPSARLLLAGDGPLRPRIEQEAESAANVRVLGALPNLAPFMGAIDLFIMPSRAEGLGSAALAAMAHGLPVIASRAGGLPEIITDGDNGWLIEPSAPQLLAAAIRRAALDRSVLRKMGERAREAARQFTSDIMTEQSLKLYRRYAKGSRRSRVET